MNDERRVKERARSSSLKTEDLVTNERGAQRSDEWRARTEEWWM